MKHFSIALMGLALFCACKLKEPPPPEKKQTLADILEQTRAAANSESATAEAPRRVDGVLPEVAAAEQESYANPENRATFAASGFPLQDVEPPTPDKIQADILTQATTLLGEGKTAEAIQLLEQSIDASTSASMDMLLATAYQNVGRNEEAIELTRVAISKYSRFRRAHRFLGILSSEAQDHKTALTSLSRAVELGDKSPELLTRIGIAHRELGNLVSAESAFRDASILSPNNISLKYYIADALFRQRRFKDAAAVLDELIQNDRNDTRWWLAQARAFQEDDQLDRAAENYEFVDRIKGLEPDQLMLLATIYAKREQFGLAVDTYLRALSSEAEIPLDSVIRAATVINREGVTWEAKRLLEGIEEHRKDELDEAGKVNIKRLQAQLAAADSLTEEQMRYLRELIELSPSDGRALLQLADYHRSREEWDLASRYFERALGIEGFEAEASIKYAYMYVQQDDYTKALPLARRAAEKNPSERLTRYVDSLVRQKELQERKAKEAERKEQEERQKKLTEAGGGVPPVKN